MCDKYNKIIIKTSKWDRIYIIKHIAKSFNKFVLIFVVHTLHSEIIFSVITLNISSYVQIYEHDLMIDFWDINIILLNEKIKTYKFWH